MRRMRRSTRKQVILQTHTISIDTRLGIIDIMNRKRCMSQCYFYLIDLYHDCSASLSYNGFRDFVENMGFSHQGG